MTLLFIQYVCDFCDPPGGLRKSAINSLDDLRIGSKVQLPHDAQVELNSGVSTMRLHIGNCRGNVTEIHETYILMHLDKLFPILHETDNQIAVDVQVVKVSFLLE